MSEELFDAEEIQFIDPSETSSVNELVETTETTETPTEKDEDEIEPIKLDIDDESEEEEEEEVEEKPKAKKEKKTKQGKEEKVDDSTFKVLAEALVEEGILSEIPEDFDGSASAFLDAFKNEQLSGAKQIFENFLDQLPPKLKKAVSSYANGLDEDSSLEIAEGFERVSSITEDSLENDINLQKEIYKENLIKKGFSKEKADKYVRRAEANDDLFDEASEALNELKDFYEKEEERKRTEIQEREQAQVENQRRQLMAIKEDIDSSDEIVPGMKVTKKVQEDLFKSMTQIVAKDEYGNPLNSVMKTRSKNPLAFEKAVHYYHMLGLFNIDDKGNFKPDMSKLLAVSKTRAVMELEKKIKTEPFKSGRGLDDDEDSDILKSFESHFQRKS